jgi:hypothetical protein
MTEIERTKDNLWGLGDKYISGSEGMAGKFLASPAGEDLVNRISFCLYQRRLRSKDGHNPCLDWQLAEALAKRGLIRQISRNNHCQLRKSQ